MSEHRQQDGVVAVMQGGMHGFGFVSVLVVLLVIALLVLAVTATVWLIRNMGTRRQPARDPGVEKTDP